MALRPPERPVPGTRPAAEDPQQLPAGRKGGAGPRRHALSAAAGGPRRHRHGRWLHDHLDRIPRPHAGHACAWFAGSCRRPGDGPRRPAWRSLR
ncbi:hypothetical protein G6F35_017788 [Rhizopus arrhizus]|nr:hypothetical protein G6F35_017788 [Rhizopus arrhizus]